MIRLNLGFTLLLVVLLNGFNLHAQVPKKDPSPPLQQTQWNKEKPKTSILQAEPSPKSLVLNRAKKLFKAVEVYRDLLKIKTTALELLQESNVLLELIAAANASSSAKMDFLYNLQQAAVSPNIGHGPSFS